MLKKYLYILALILQAGCSTDEVLQQEPENHEFMLTTDVLPFSGEAPFGTRSTIDGTGFEDGDWIRLKIICPFVKDAEYGESTWGNSYDAFFLLKRSGGSWTYLTSADHCDITGSYSYSGSPQVGSFYEAQQTPYVYVASTWSEEKNFKTSSGAHILQYCHVFHADQRKAEHYKASDLLWAQQYMQTGAWNVHLSFEHKMACLTLTLDDSALTAPNPAYDPESNSEVPPTIPSPLTSNVVLTLEGMPDIDQQEIVVGDYYADASKINSSFGYRQKASCSSGNNGRVLGIGVNDDAASRAKVAPMTGNPVPGGAYSSVLATVPNTGTYTAYKVDNTHFRMIVPPCVLTEHAQIWVRDGERRYKMQLERLEFHEGELYPVNVKL